MNDEKPPGWYPDPTARHEYRFWDGSGWTDHVADQGAQALDALPPIEAPSTGTPTPSPTSPQPWRAPAGRPRHRGRRVAAAVLAAVLVVTVAVVTLVAVGNNNSTSPHYPKFCATAAKLDPIAGDAASVLKNAAPIASTLVEIGKLPAAELPIGAAATARSLAAELVGWRFGTLAVYYDPDTFEPLPSAVQRWQSTARELWSTIKDSCPTTSTKFFAAGGPQTPATTTPPRRVAGWAAPGVRTLCLVSDATFAGSPVSRQQILDATSLDAGLKARRILLAPPGQPCDATLTVAFTGSALSAEYVGAGRLYTGATMSGRLTLAATDLPNLVIPVSHRENPPGTTSEFRSSLPQTPADAFHHLGLADAVGAALDQWFGPT